MTTIFHKALAALALFAAAGLASAQEAQAAEGERTDRAAAERIVEQARETVRTLAADKDFEAMRAALGNARAVLVFPRLVRAGFVLGGAGGNGVLLVRDSVGGNWVGPAFYTLASASLGLQAGVATAETVMVIRSQKALESLYANKVKLGGDVAFALGRRGGERGASVTADFVVYSRAQGAFAGLAVDGAILDIREALAEAYYGRPASPADILASRSVQNAQAGPLQQALKDATGAGT